MADIEHQTQKKSNGKRVGLLVGGIITSALIVSYLGLCFWVAFSGRLLPNSEAMSLDLGGMTYEEADTKLLQAFNQCYPDEALELYQTSTDITVSIPTDVMTLSVDRSTGNFFVGGASFLKSLLSPTAVTPTVTFSSSSEDYLQTTVEDFASRCNQALSDSVIQVTDTDLKISKGFSGYAVDEAATIEAVKLLLEDAVSAVSNTKTDSLSLEAVSSTTVPVTPDFDLVYEEVYVEPQDATLDKKTFDITPSVTGISFDVAKAQQAYADLKEGESLTIPLVQTEPEITTAKLEASLFHDVLGYVSTTIGGVANRISNVKNAAKYCNQIILLPGETFSYTDTVGPFTTANGYLLAPAYVGGATVDEMAGGICQVSSSIYYAALKSNLEIVERHSHMYAVGYVPDGMDATVYSNSLDFQFKNNTNYPIKIVTSTPNRTLKVTIYGTNTTGNYVVMTNSRTSTTEYEVVYVPDETVPIGTTVEAVTPYTGRTVEAYRNVYSANGTLISSKLESVNTYKKRDQVIHYNPADAVALGLAESSKANGTVIEPSTTDTSNTHSTTAVPDLSDTNTTVTTPPTTTDPIVPSDDTVPSDLPVTNSDPIPTEDTPTTDPAADPAQPTVP